MNGSIPAPSGASIPGEHFIAISGQSFSSQQDWVNRATRYLTAHPHYNNTEHGEHSGWRGDHFTALCFDQAGNRMRNGGDFMRATDDGTYPVWWVWPDQINDLLKATSASSVGTETLQASECTPSMKAPSYE